MDWRKFFLNLGAAAAGGFASAVAQTPAGAAPSKATIIGAVLVPVLANALGLFQSPPHQGA